MGYFTERKNWGLKISWHGPFNLGQAISYSMYTTQGFPYKIEAKQNMTS